MNKYWTENPNNNIVQEYKSRTTEREFDKDLRISLFAYKVNKM